MGYDPQVQGSITRRRAIAARILHLKYYRYSISLFSIITITIAITIIIIITITYIDFLTNIKIATQKNYKCSYKIDIYILLFDLKSNIEKPFPTEFEEIEPA